MKVLVTGAAGFIGMHVAKLLLERGDEVVGIDNLNDYYDPNLKLARLDQLMSFTGFKFIQGDIADRAAVEELFSTEKPTRVVNLAAQAGVRYSLRNPNSYIQTNLVGFANILEGCRHNGVKHLVFASSSSVYGANTKVPYSVNDNVDCPVSLYAATKKANELMAHSYSHLYGLPTTGLRYFTVYGPWGRPDMSPWLFTSAILEKKSIDVYNMGNMKRDFTYIDDIAEATVRVLDRIPARDECITENKRNQLSRSNLYKIYNIGNQQPTELMTFIEIIENSLGMKCKKNLMPMQPGDVVATFADVKELIDDVGFQPKIGLIEGVTKWKNWYIEYRRINKM